MAIPTVKELKNILFDEDEALAFMLENNILYRPGTCISCDGRVSRYKTNWRCTRKLCRKSVSIYTGSCFEQSKLKLCDSLFIAYLWLCGDSPKAICIKTGHSPQTITRNIMFLQKVVSKKIWEIKVKIGGPGIVVEIDESKFGRRKYNRGHAVDGAWVLGGVERTEVRGMFAVIVPDRRAETIMKVIKKYVRPGSIVYTDMFRSYINLERDLGLIHFTVNHSINFVDSVTGVHTNTIEGTWAGMKFNISPRRRTNLLLRGCLEEFIWRRMFGEDLWNALISALSIESFNSQIFACFIFVLSQ